MEPRLNIVIQDRQTEFKPGDRLKGEAEWSLPAPPTSIEIRLFWYTQGKGDQDLEIIETISVSPCEQEGQRDFAFDLPRYPYSFSGKLISLLWAVEFVALPTEAWARADFVMSPTGREVVLYR